MSYETNRCDRIVCDYPDCDATTRLWREDEDSAFSDADDLNWLTVEVGLDGDDYVERHFCPRHLDTTRPEWASGYILPDVLTRNGWNVLGFGTMFLPKDECASVIAGVLEKADGDGFEHIPDAKLERAAMALCRCENDWTDGEPDDRELLLRWNGMSEDGRDRYANRVLPVLEAFLAY